jgi:hypothetical protein
VVAPASSADGAAGRRSPSRAHATSAPAGARTATPSPQTETERRLVEPATNAGPTRRTAAARPDLLRRTMVMAVVSRVLTGVAGGLATWLIGVKPAPWAQRLPRLAEPFHGVLAHVFNPWAVWDGVWYIKIAADGYAGNDGSVAFFPLYPLLVRWLGIVFDNNLVIAGIVLSLACYFGAIYALYKLVAPRYGSLVAYRTCLYLSIFPTAFYWQAVYSESAFLLLSIVCILWSMQGRWKLAGLAGLLAALTRSAGFLLIVPMFVCYAEQRDWKLRRADADAASLLMIPEGLMVWMAYLSLRFGKPLLFAQVQDQWRRYLAVPTFALWKSLEAAFQGTRQLLSAQTSHLYWPASQPGAVMPLAAANIINLGSLALGVLPIIYGLRRLPLALSLYAIVTIGYPLLFPATSMPLMSMPRFVLAAFPVFMSAALFTEHRPKAHRIIAGVLIACCVALTAKFAMFSWVA